MRPCNRCGEPIGNQALFCDNCEGVAEVDDNDNATPQAEKESPKRSEVLWFGAEFVVRTLMVSLPTSIALGFVLFFASETTTALFVAGFIGLFAGVGWTMVEMYFQSGPHGR